MGWIERRPGPQGQQQNVAQLGWEAWNSAGRRCPWKQYLLAKMPFSNLVRFIHELRIENMQGMYQHKPLWGQPLVERQSTSFAKNLSCQKTHCKTWRQSLSQIWHCTWRLSHRKWLIFWVTQINNNARQCTSQKCKHYTATADYWRQPFTLKIIIFWYSKLFTSWWWLWTDWN